MRLRVVGALLVIGCGSSMGETCDLAARPGSWRITTTFDHTYASPPEPCPTIQLTVDVPKGAGDYTTRVYYSPASSELGSKDECWINYVRGSPADAGGRTGCAGYFESGSANRTAGDCIVAFGPPDSYGDYSSFCYYTAVWERVN